MTPIVRVLLGLVLLTLVLGTAAVSVLAAESERRRGLARLTGVGETTGARRIAHLSGRLASRWPFTVVGRRLAAAGQPWNPVVVTLAMVGAIGLTLVVGRLFLGYIGSSIIAAIMPWAGLQWLKRAAVRRREDFTAQLPELARIIANGNAAGLSVSRSIAMAGRELSEPAGSEMARVAAHLDLGWSLDAALHDLGEQLPSRELNVLVRTIVIQARTGGALTDALLEISQTLEDRKELRREVRTVILGSAMSGYAVIGISAGSVIVLNLFKPGMLDNLASTMVGRVVLVIAFGFFAAGAMLMRIVSRVEV